MCLPPCPSDHPPVAGPHQLGFGTPGGAEAAVHAGQVYLMHLPPGHAMVKVDLEKPSTVSIEVDLRLFEDHGKALVV